MFPEPGPAQHLLQHQRLPPTAQQLLRVDVESGRDLPAQLQLSVCVLLRSPVDPSAVGLLVLLHAASVSLSSEKFRLFGLLFLTPADPAQRQLQHRTHISGGVGPGPGPGGGAAEPGSKPGSELGPVLGSTTVRREERERRGCVCEGETQTERGGF